MRLAGEKVKFTDFSPWKTVERSTVNLTFPIDNPPSKKKKRKHVRNWGFIKLITALKI